jgi:hypothetical protein
MSLMVTTTLRSRGCDMSISPRSISRVLTWDTPQLTLLLERLEGRRDIAQHLLIPPTLVKRGTTAGAPGAKSKKG